MGTALWFEDEPRKKVDVRFASRWYTTKEIALAMTVTPDTVARRWTKAGLKCQELRKGKRYRGEWINEFLGIR
jgi:hypothetical protein